MIIRIGITQVVKEVEIDLGDDGDAASVKADIEAAIAAGSSMVWLTDRKGRQVGMATEKIAYVDVGAPDADQRIGFG